MDDAGHELNYSLEGLPRSLFRGYDRRATEQLFGRLSASYRSLQAERMKVARELDELQQSLAERGQGEQRLSGELEQMQATLKASEEREKSLAERLDRAKRYMDDEVEKVRAEAARELERVQAEAERALDLARADLAGYEKREALVKDMLEATRRSVESIKEEARGEAERILKKAREREAKIVGDARREHERLDAERQRLTDTAAELRDDLSAVLVSTLEQLTPDGQREGRHATSGGPSSPQSATGRTPGVAGDPTPHADEGASEESGIGSDAPAKGRRTPRR